MGRTKETGTERTYDLEPRLIEFAVMVIEIVDHLPNTRIGNHLEGQLGRSGSSPALNYGEALAAESRADFVHKMKVCLKELRESRVCMLIIKGAGLLDSDECLTPVLTECNELIAIFNTSIQTAKRNAGNDNRKN